MDELYTAHMEMLIMIDLFKNCSAKLIRHTGIALLFFSAGSHAQVPLIEQIQSELEESLYSIKTVLPDYERPTDAPPRFAVAEFRTSNDELYTWSQAIAEIIRYRIQYVPGVRLVMPNPFRTHYRAKIIAETDRR